MNGATITTASIICKQDKKICLFVFFFFLERKRECDLSLRLESLVSKLGDSHYRCIFAFFVILILYRVARPFAVAAKAGTVRLASWVGMHRTQHKNATQLQKVRENLFFDRWIYFKKNFFKKQLVVIYRLDKNWTFRKWINGFYVSWNFFFIQSYAIRHWDKNK